MNSNTTKLKKLALCGLLAAFVFVGTQIRVPTAIGYINLGRSSKRYCMFPRESVMKFLQDRCNQV